jgi:hypothetical protein
LDYLDDLESDFSAIHGISDMYSLPSAKFFKFAYRLPAYQGVMRMLVEEEAEMQQRQDGITTGDSTYREVPADAISTDVELSEFIDFGEA